METYQEQGRVIGLLLRALFTRRFRVAGLPPVAALAGALLTLIAFLPDWPAALYDWITVLADEI